MEYKHNPPSLSELRAERKPVRNTHVQHLMSLSLSEKIAVYIHRAIGSFGFFFLIMVWTVAWLAWNILAPLEMRFDPAPAFVIWLFASNILHQHSQ